MSNGCDHLCGICSPPVLCVFTTLCCLYKDGTPTTKTFEHVASEIGAEESEEVGVEHLLR